MTIFSQIFMFSNVKSKFNWKLLFDKYFSVHAKAIKWILFSNWQTVQLNQTGIYLNGVLKALEIR